MKFLLLCFFIATAASGPTWHTDFDEAQKIAAQNHQLIVLNFSGSDWCGPCIRMRKEIFESEEFKDYATQNLVLINADFPRSKKNQLSKEQVTKNEMLAERFNQQGSFPLTLVMDADGKILKKYDGFPGITAAQFINGIKELTHANN